MNARSTLLTATAVILLSNIPTAKTDTFSAFVVASCGARSLTAGQSYPLVMDTTGTLCASGGSGGGGTVAIPYSYTAMTGAQFNQAATTAQTLTIPSGAKFARVCAITSQMNFADSVGSTPTVGAAPTTGTPLAAGSCLWLAGSSTLSNFGIINAVASSGVWSAEYYQ